ncbi:MAG: glycerate kinase [Eubacteriales bacterium]
MKVLISADSYKGSMESVEVAERIKKGVVRVFPDAEFQVVSMADGGEGTVDSVLARQKGKRVSILVRSPLLERVDASYGVLEDGTAIMEMAAASGLPLVASEKLDVMKATTYGTGEMILDALDKGCRKIYIGIGGSATNDAGIGMAQALGASFRDGKGQEVGIGGGELDKIETIDLSKMDKRLDETEIVVMCDVTNPLYGINGATNIYGRQKGATEDMIQNLDIGMEHIADLMCATSGIDARWEKGAGAAGGLGWGLVVFTKAKLQSGIESILELTGFEEKCEWADIVITGEGKIDSQSVCGKVIDGMAKITKKHNKPLVAIVGCIDDDYAEIYKAGVNTVEACVARPMDVEFAMHNTKEYLPNAAERVMRAIGVGLELNVGMVSDKREKIRFVS